MKITCTDPYDGREISVDDDALNNPDGAIRVEITENQKSLSFCFSDPSEISDFSNALATMKSRLEDFQGTTRKR